MNSIIDKNNIQNTWCGEGCLRMGMGDNIVITNVMNPYLHSIISVAADYFHKNTNATTKDFLEEYLKRINDHEFNNRPTTR